MRRTVTVLMCVAGALGAGPAAVRAQESLLPSASWGLAPIASLWHFATPIAQAAGAVTDVQQIALPFRVRAQFGSNWSLDLSGAGASSTIRIKSSAGTDTRLLTLSGATAEEPTADGKPPA